MNLLGIDIGGTKIAVCIGDENGNVQVDQRFPTDANDPKTTLDRAVEVAEELIEKSGLTVEQVDAIGISSPGPMCSKRRMILETPNMQHERVERLQNWRFHRRKIQSPRLYAKRRQRRGAGRIPLRCAEG